MDLSVCIVSHESSACITRCLQSVYAVVNQIATEVIVVDNRSLDDSARLVREGFPQAHLSVNARRQGFAGNINQAFRLSSGRYLLALNPDTVILNDALVQLVGFMDATPEAAAAGCKTFYPDGRLQYTCRQFPSVATVLWRWLQLERYYQPTFYRRFLMAGWSHGRATARRTER